MRIIVPIKQVPETSAVRMDEATGTMVREGVEAIINPLDLYAIELAIQLREQHRGQVVAVSMGPPKAEAALREAMAMGVDEAVLITDRAFAGSDTWATSYVLAAAVRKLAPFDIVICGERATDGDTGQVGPGVAAFLGLPVVSYVCRFDSLTETGPDTVSGRVHRLVEDGREVLDVDLPAVLTVVKEIANPRLPTLRGKQRARSAAVPIWNVTSLDVEPGKIGLTGSPTRVVKIFHPKVARQCEMLPAGDESAIDAAADHVVQFLHERRLL